MNATARVFEARPAVRRRDTPKPLPSQDELRAMFDFDEASGTLIWRKPAGTPRNDGYISVRFGGRNYLAHRLIWKWLHGTEPPVVDHKDGDPSNNRPHNLRSAGRVENMSNRRGARGKKLPKGVFQYGKSRFFAQIRADGVLHRLGYFDTPEEAQAAYCQAAAILHRDFARTA